MANNDFDNLFDDEQQVSDNQVSDNNESKDVKPVKLSRGATAGIIIAGIFIIMIAVITIKSCTIEKKVNSSEKQGSTISVTEIVTESAEKVTEIAPKTDENSAISQEVVTTSPENYNSNNSATGNINEGTSLKEVALPAFGNELETTGIVLSKHAYSYENSYIYGVSISMLVGENTQTVQYFCPKNTYDALSSADTLKVKYQQDSSGAISIMSISK